MSKTSKNRQYFVLLSDFNEAEETKGYLVQSNTTLEPSLLSLEELKLSLNKAENSLSQDELVIIFPGSSILQCYINTPKLTGSKLERAIYWSIEPFLSNNIEDNQISWLRSPSKGQPNRYLITAISKKKWLNWHGVLSSHGLHSAKLTSLGQLLSLAKTESLFVWQNWFLYKKEEGLACLKKEQRANIFGVEQEKTTEIVTSLTESDTDQQQVSLHDLFFQNPDISSSNFINYGFKNTKQNRLSDYINPKAVFIAASICLISITFFNFFAGYQFHKKAEEYDLISKNFYQTWFPEDQRIFNIRRQLEGKLQNNVSVKSLDNVTTLLEITSASMQQVIANPIIERMRYQRDANAMEMVILVDSMDDIEQLEASLSDRSIRMDIQSATRKSAGLEVSVLFSSNSSLVL